jgi:hypothetical protein
MSERACPRLIEIALPIRRIPGEGVRDKSLRPDTSRCCIAGGLGAPWRRRGAGVVASIGPAPDDPRCPADFRDAGERHLQTHVPTELKYYR